MFFFEKKNQETFASWEPRRPARLRANQREKSFLLLFFNKEVSSF